MNTKQKLFLVLFLLIAFIGISLSDGVIIGGGGGGRIIPRPEPVQIAIDLPSDITDTLANLQTITETICDENGENCQNQITVEGISTPTITPTKPCNGKECCYDLIEEPLYHRYDTCLADTNDATQNQANILDYMKQDLVKIAENKNETNTLTENPDVTPSPVEIIRTPIEPTPIQQLPPIEP